MSFSSRMLAMLGGSAVVSGLPQPTMVQHLSLSSNPWNLGAGAYGPNFTFTLPNDVGAGNCVVMGLLYPNGQAPSTITDSIGNSWSATPVVSADNGAGNYVSAIFVLPNASAGKMTITVNFGTGNNQIVPFQATVTEFNNVATVSPVNGTSSTVGQTGSSLTVSAFTPTANNNANGGNLIWAYFALGAAAANNSHVSDWTAGGNFTLLDGNIAFQGQFTTQNDPVPTASMWWVQAAQASVTPGITAGAQTTTQYNNVAVALKAANAGTPRPAGIYINKMIWASYWTSVANMPIKCPATGNFHVLLTEMQTTNFNITGCTDNETGLQWTFSNGASGQSPSMFYRAGGVNQNLLATVTVGTPPTNPATIVFLDLSGVNTSNPIGATAFTTHVNLPSTPSDQSPTPSITPTQVGSLLVAASSVDIGPVTALNAPTGNEAFFDSVVYDNQSDVSLMCNSDYYAHYFTPSLTTVNFGFHIAPNPAVASGMAPAAWEFLHP